MRKPIYRQTDHTKEKKHILPLKLEKKKTILDLSDSEDADEKAQIRGEYITFNQIEETMVIQAMTRNKNGTLNCCRVDSLKDKDWISLAKKNFDVLK